MVIAFHKPYGVLCQFTPDQPGQRTLADFGFPKNVYSLGRLDMDSEGLLLLSDESRLNDRLLNPKHAHQRTYLVQVEGIPDSSGMSLRSLKLVWAGWKKSLHKWAGFKVDFQSASRAAGVVKLTTACRGLGRVAPGCARAATR